MPGFPFAGCETSYSRSTGQASHQDACMHLSEEEKLAAEESFSVYCKPVELYNILQRRAKRNPSFLQRCLGYKIEARKKKRIQMTVLLSWSADETQAVLPLYICLARPIKEEKENTKTYSAVYKISRIFIFRDSSEIDGDTQVEANFMLPEVRKLAVQTRSSQLDILLFTTVENPNSSSGVNESMTTSNLSSSESRDGEYCLWGKVSLQSLYKPWTSSPNFSLRQRAEIMSTVDLRPCFLKYAVRDKERSISIQAPKNSENVITSKQVQITISAEECGVKEKPAHHTYATNQLSSPSLYDHIIQRLKKGNVKFNYRYYNNKMQRTEVTEDFSCPFCLVRCVSHKGIKCHLSSSHDLFNFEFPASEDCQTINVSVKIDTVKSEIVADGAAPKFQTFMICVKPLKRAMPEDEPSEKAKDADPLESDEIPAGDAELLEKADGVSNAAIQSHPDPESVPPISEHDDGTPAGLQVAKTGKSRVEHSDSRNTALLRKRQFYHSHKAQPMSLEEVLSDEDSEKDIDEEVADIEDRRMLDNFVDVTDDEKKFMHMWNSFVRRQRLRADGHIPWACSAFVKLHGLELVQNPGLAWCWRLLTIKLWNHGLLDARTINTCSITLEEYKKQISNPKS